MGNGNIITTRSSQLKLKNYENTIVVYNALKENLTKNNPEWTEEKIQAIAFASGVTSALLSGYGLHKLTKGLGINEG